MFGKFLVMASKHCHLDRYFIKRTGNSILKYIAGHSLAGKNYFKRNGIFSRISQNRPQRHIYLFLSFIMHEFDLSHVLLAEKYHLSLICGL